MSELLRSQVKVQEADPAIRPIQGLSTAVSLFLGVTERGPVRTPTEILDLAEFDRVFGKHRASVTLRTAVEGHFAEGGGRCWVSRTVHYTDISDPATEASVKATKTFSTDTIATATAGAVTSTNSSPFDLEPGDTLIVHCDEDVGGPDTATFSATAAILNGGAGPYDLTGNVTLNLTINGTLYTYDFVAGDFVGGLAGATRAEVANAINREFMGVQAYDDGANLKVRTDLRGTDATLVATGTAAVVLGLDVGPTASTGNVANIDAVTAAEVKTVVEAAVTNPATGVVVTGTGAITITSGTTGAGSSVQVEVASTADDEMGFDNVKHDGAAVSPAVNTLRIDAKYSGGWGDDLSVEIATASNAEAAYFDIKVYLSSILQEVWPNLSMVDTDDRYVEDIVNHATSGSILIAAVDLDAAVAAPADRPVNIAAQTLAAGDDGIGALVDADFTGSASGETGLYAFDEVTDGTILAVPERSSLAAVSTAMVAYAETTREGSLFCLIDPPASLTASGAKADLTARGLTGLTEYGAYHWPRIKVVNPNKTVFGGAESITVPPSGHISGLLGRVDASKIGGVYEPPAGEEVGRLLTVIGLETEEVLKDAARDLVFPVRINPITKTPGGVIYVDGARCLKGNGNFPAISERRGVMFIEASIDAGIQWARHRNNDESLRLQLHRSVYAFLLLQMRAKAFRSMDPSAAFSVNFGADLNPPTEVFANRVNGEVGVATQKPAEFIILTFRQDTRDIQAELAEAGA